MMMNTLSNLNTNAGRTFAIEVVGSPVQAALRTSAYTMKVAYANLSQTIHSIGKRGGKIVSVHLLNPPITPITAATTASDNSETGELRRHSSKSKKR